MADSPQESWNIYYECWLQFLNGIIDAVDAGRAIPLGPMPEPLVPPAPKAAEAPARVVICAPHPDDEALSGALALRLRVDSGALVTNVAVTLGSDRSQRARRLHELESACLALGFKLVVPQSPSGLENVNESNRLEKKDEWARKVQVLCEIFDREKPDAVLAPHAHDFNTTHVGTHWLVMDALGEHLERSGRGPVLLVETEIWHQIEKPNLMLGLTPGFVAAQLVGACEHGDEMRRSPYHLLHPCRLMENVRRGSEVVGGQGSPARDFVFAEIYNVVLMEGRKRLNAPRGHIVSPSDVVSVEWLTSRFWPDLA